MYVRGNADTAEDLFKPISRRSRRCVYFVRVFKDGPRVQAVLEKYAAGMARKGVWLEERIPNPDQRQLAYMTEVLGDAFQPEADFVEKALVKWMPRMQSACRADFASAMAGQFELMRRQNKPEAAIRNVYIKMMCWLYYKFERIMPFLGDDDPPRVLYEGSRITQHELYFLNVISSLGADILLLEKEGDDGYRKLDPSSACSQPLMLGVKSFDPDFSIRALLKKAAQAERTGPAVQPAGPAVQVPKPAGAYTPSGPAASPAQKPGVGEVLDRHFPKPARTSCVNAWMKEADMEAMLEPVIARGDDPRFFYHTYILYSGARDRLTYMNELYQLYQKLIAAGRQVLVLENKIPPASPDEISRIRRRPYRMLDELIIDLAGNLPANASRELQMEQQAAYLAVVKELAVSETNLSRLTSQVVQLLCLIQRYQPMLFQGYRDTSCPCLICMCRELSPSEQLYIRYVSRLPVDVLILAPDLNFPVALKDEGLLEIRGTESVSGAVFPRDESGLQMRTVASMAEQDLDTMLYGQSGMYRRQQFGTARSITLKTTYDELSILWDKELKFRPNFSTEGGSVSMPVLYAKVSGVEGGRMEPYWQKIRMLSDNKDTILYRQLPIRMEIHTIGAEDMASKYLRDGIIRREALRSDRRYPFGHLRDETQQHIFDKVQLMLDQRYIRGTFENGTEYRILSTILNLDREIQRKLQAFDFTRNNPKVLCVHTSEAEPSLTDAILCTFFNLVGMDVVLFVPTGYQTIERFLQGNLPVEHQIGDYVYDQHMPDLSTLQGTRERSWLDNLFRRG